MAAMIRTVEALARVLASGRSVSLQGEFSGGGVRLATEDTNETVSRSALARCIASGKARPAGVDLTGQPYRWEGVQ